MNEMQVDNSEVLRMFSELDEKQRKTVFRRALSESSRILVKETRKQLRGVKTKRGMLSTKTGDRWTGKNLESGVRYKVSKDAKEAKVHILGHFLLKMFEMGTKDRYTKYHKGKTGEGGYRGRIDASKFFVKGKEMSERKVFDSMDQTFSKHVERINTKYK